MTKYYATRNILLGRFAGQESVALAVGAEVEYDGKKMKYQDNEDVFPHFDAVVRSGWLTETPVRIAKADAKASPKIEDTKETKIRSAKNNTPVSLKVEPEFQVAGTQAPATKKTAAAPKKAIILEADDDQRIVATNISSKGIPKKAEPSKTTPVLRSGIEEPEGEPVPGSRFKTSTHSKTTIGK
jgi:hypothetical protein